MFWRFPCEILANKADFVNPSFPAFSFSLSRSDHIKHFCLCHRFYLFDRHIPLTSFFFTFLFDHIRQYFGVSLLLSIHEISGHCSFLNVLYSAFGILFFVLFDRLFHLYLLFKPLSVEQFGFDTFEGLGLLGNNFSFSCFLLSSFFLSIQSLTKSFLMQIHVIVLRHCIVRIVEANNYNTILL